jgi:hypothetical protein
MSFSAPGPRPADAPGRCSLDLGFKIKNGIHNFQQHVAARFREPSASCTFPSHGHAVSSVVLAQMIIGIRAHRCGCPRNPESGNGYHQSAITSRNVVFPGGESIFDLRITLQPRAAPDPSYKGAGAPQRDDGGAAHARPRSSRSPRKRAPTVVAARRVTPQIEGVPARASGAHLLLLSLFHTLPLRASPPSARGRRDSAAAAAATRERWEECACVRVLSAIWAEQPIEHLLTKRAIWATPSGAS